MNLKKGIIESEEELKRKSRNLSIKEGSAHAVMEGFGTRNITPYALSLGATNAHIGFLSSVPSLVGNLLQIQILKLMEKFPRKKIVYLGALIQALMWLPLIGVGALFFIFNIKSSLIIILLIFFYTLIVVAGTSKSPAWNSWMKDLVTQKSGRYFGTRNKICGSIVLLSMLVAGLILDHSKKTNIFIGFAILFGFAALFRMVSSSLFRKKYEPSIKYGEGYYFSFMQFIKAIRKNNFGRFAIYISLMSFATAIAAPFFAVYMLKDLNFSYIVYTLIVVSSSLTNLIFMPIWGKFADKHGNINVIRICGFLIPLVPILWLISPFIFLTATNNSLIVYLILIEAFSGFAWAGFNLSSSTFIYDAVSRERMAICVTYSNILNSSGILIGALIGGLLSSQHFFVIGLTPILLIFLLSGVARFLVSLVMIPMVKEVRYVKKLRIQEAIEKILILTQKKILR